MQQSIPTRFHLLDPSDCAAPVPALPPSARIPTWSAAMSVRHPLLDEQHIMLLELGRSVLRDIERQPPASDADLRIALLDVQTVARRHVACEEAVLAASGAPDWQEHRIEHRAELERLQSLCEPAADRPLNRFAVAACLVDWMSRHVREFDLPQAAYLRDRAASTYDRAQAPTSVSVTG